MHFVCERLMQLDKRHGDHLAGLRHPFNSDPEHLHSTRCDCLYDDEGHDAVTVAFPPGSKLAGDHPALTCRCGRRMVVGEVMPWPGS